MQNLLSVVFSLDLLPKLGLLLPPVLENFIPSENVNHEIIPTKLLQLVNLPVGLDQTVKLLLDAPKQVLFFPLLLFANGSLGFHVFLLQHLLVVLDLIVILVVNAVRHIEDILHHLLSIRVIELNFALAPPIKLTLKSSTIEHSSLVGNLKRTNTTFH